MIYEILGVFSILTEISYKKTQPVLGHRDSERKMMTLLVKDSQFNLYVLYTILNTTGMSAKVREKELFFNKKK